MLADPRSVNQELKLGSGEFSIYCQATHQFTYISKDDLLYVKRKPSMATDNFADARCIENNWYTKNILQYKLLKYHTIFQEFMKLTE